MFDLFGWLRSKARDAVLGGIADALSEIRDADDAAPALADLRQRLTPALPAPEPEAVSAGNGRRRKGD